MEWPEDSEEKFKYSFGVIPTAASVIYGLGLLLPVTVKLVVNFAGKGDRTEGITSYLTAVGIYGYSFTSFLAMSILCGLLPWSSI